MVKEKIPEQIQNLLTPEEVIEHSFRLIRARVYVTNRRLLELRGRTVSDFDYEHISSIGYATKRYWITLIAGIICIAVSLLFKSDISDTLFWGGIGFGGLMIATGLFIKPEWLEITVIGLPKPVILQGPRDRLDSLLQVVKAKQPSPQSATTIDSD